MVKPRNTILLAGGGSGGHIFPNVAICQQFALVAPDLASSLDLQLITCDRAIDLAIATSIHWPTTAIKAVAPNIRPWRWLTFLQCFYRSRQQLRHLIQANKAKALICTGGFVSAPAVSAARAEKVPIFLLNLDASPGRANAIMAKHAHTIFSVHDCTIWPTAQRIGFPLRQEALCELSSKEAKQKLGLATNRPVLLITGASQGAHSINQMMLALANDPSCINLFKSWQILHLAGKAKDAKELKTAYQKAGVEAKTIVFLEQMGLAWRAADLAISRAGAGSVAEAHANATPTIFMPYPYHHDEHQRLNALPLEEQNAATILKDQIDPQANLPQIISTLRELMQDNDKRLAMQQRLATNSPINGATQVATQVLQAVGLLS